ncbi:hypothetical protein NQZ68_039225 [Dissostichus eleginoides]|nr:hypothetical protein NQZ68_039225 [Dissostichus eleginoides]
MLLKDRREDEQQEEEEEEGEEGEEGSPISVMKPLTLDFHDYTAAIKKNISLSISSSDSPICQTEPPHLQLTPVQAAHNNNAKL